MTSPADSPVRHRQIWPWILGLVLAPILALGGMIWNAVHLSSDAAALRRQIMAASGGGWRTRVQFTVDRTGVALVRGVLALMAEAPVEAREALAAVRSASVGVYQRGELSLPLREGSIIDVANSIMMRRGWRRFLEVADSGKTVLIYLPLAEDKALPSQICLAVCDRHELVIVAADLNADRMAAFALGEISRQKLAAR